MPCYGGEEGQESLYSLEMMPLPYGVAKNDDEFYFAQRLRYRIVADEDCLHVIGSSRLARHQRTVRHQGRTIEVVDRIQLAHRLARRLKVFYPLVLWSFELVAEEEHRYRICGDPVVYLEVEGIEGPIARRTGYCARGEIVGLEEAVSYPTAGKWERRSYILMDHVERMS